MNCVCLNLNTSKSRVPSSTVCTLHTYVMHEFWQSCLKLNMLKHVPNIKKTVAFDELANMFCKNLRLLEPLVILLIQNYSTVKITVQFNIPKHQTNP